MGYLQANMQRLQKEQKIMKINEICADCKKELHIEDSPVKIINTDFYDIIFNNSPLHTYRCQLCYTGGKVFPGSGMGVQSKKNKTKPRKMKLL